jgi:hypothetical protein
MVYTKVVNNYKFNNYNVLNCGWLVCSLRQFDVNLVQGSRPLKRGRTNMPRSFEEY